MFRFSRLNVVLVFFLTGPSMFSAAPAVNHEPKVIVNTSKARKVVYAPVPEYPKEARKNHWGGFGIFEVQFRGDGLVHAVFVTMSTGHKVLDDTTVSTLRQWRSWKGYRMIAVMVPIIFAPGDKEKKEEKRK